MASEADDGTHAAAPEGVLAAALPMFAPAVELAVGVSAAAAGGEGVAEAGEATCAEASAGRGEPAVSISPRIGEEGGAAAAAAGPLEGECGCGTQAKHSKRSGNSLARLVRIKRHTTDGY